MISNELTLRRRDAAETCTPPSTYVRDEEHNVLSVPICHGPTNRVYLPLVMRH